MIKATGRRWSTEYKEPVIAVLVRRALEQCATDALPESSGQAGRALRCAPGGSKPARGAGHSATSDGARRSARPASETSISTTINGRPHTLTVPANITLLDLLRDHLGLMGTKCGCEIGECGACTVLLDGQPVNSCLVLAPQIEGRQVLTVEGLAQNGKLHPLQESFLDHDAVHCGFCTPGHVDERQGPAGLEPARQRSRDSHRHLRQPLPLHRLPADRSGHREGSRPLVWCFLPSIGVSF